MANITGYITLSANAGVAELNTVVDCYEIKLLKNDGAGDITFNIDNAVADGNTITLKSGESLENFPVYVHKLYYKTVANPTAFRFIGLREKNF